MVQICYSTWHLITNIILYYNKKINSLFYIFIDQWADDRKFVVETFINTLGDDHITYELNDENVTPDDFYTDLMYNDYLEMAWINITINSSDVEIFTTSLALIDNDQFKSLLKTLAELLL